MPEADCIPRMGGNAKIQMPTGKKLPGRDWQHAQKRLLTVEWRTGDVQPKNRFPSTKECAKLLLHICWVMYVIRPDSLKASTGTPCLSANDGILANNPVPVKATLCKICETKEKQCDTKLSYTG